MCRGGSYFKSIIEYTLSAELIILSKFINYLKPHYTKSQTKIKYVID